MSENEKVYIILQSIAVVLSFTSTVMLGLRCKCRGKWGEIAIRPKSSPLTPPDVTKPADSGEKRPLMLQVTEKCGSNSSDVVIDIKQ